MPFTLIKGTFHVTGYSPDGDSIRFKAHTKSNWNNLEKTRRPVLLNKKYHAQLRLEGADALETHYKSKHQPKDIGYVATDFLLDSLGIKNVVWTPSHYRVRSADDGTPGYLLTRSTDVYGRPVSFIFTGNTPKKDGQNYFLSKSWLKQSLNYKLLKSGNAFPTFYTSMFWDLRDEITKAVKQARSSNIGVWPYDWSDAIPETTMDSISYDYVIFPKLFRRLVAHLKKGGKISEFNNYLKDNPDKLIILKHAHESNFENIIETSGKKVMMTELPEYIAFIAKD